MAADWVVIIVLIVIFYRRLYTALRHNDLCGGAHTGGLSRPPLVMVLTTNDLREVVDLDGAWVADIAARGLASIHAALDSQIVQKNTTGLSRLLHHVLTEGGGLGPRPPRLHIPFLVEHLAHRDAPA